MTLSYDPAKAAGGFHHEMDRLGQQVDLTWTHEFEILQRCGLKNGDRIADMGCGPGFFGARLLKALPKSPLLGVDADPDLCRLAQERWQPFAPRAQIFQGSVYDLPARFAATQDWAVSRYVMQHLADPAAGAKGLSHMLVPGGTVAVVDIDEGMWGCAVPQEPIFERLYRKAAQVQTGRGGDRMIGRKLLHILKEAGLQDARRHVFAVHSDEVGIAALDFHLNPSRLLPSVSEGVVSLGEYAEAQIAYQRFQANPEAVAVILGFVATARKPLA